jgi:16S rRNA processing protein RimM
MHLAPLKLTTLPDERILMGVIGRPHGVRGLVHVQSYTADPTALADYGVLEDERGRTFTLRWQNEGVARLAERIAGRDVPVADRSTAEALTNTRLFVPRSALPPAEADEYYLTDLIGLRAEDSEGQIVGHVAIVHDYGGGPSLEIALDNGAAPLILPFTARAVPVVDLPAGRIVIDPPETTAGEPQGPQPDGGEVEARA